MNELINKIESVLFISHQPLSLQKLVSLTGAKKVEVQNAIEELQKRYNEKKGGVIVQVQGDKVQMATAPESAEVIKSFVSQETTGELTRAALETLTIIAYRGPITRPELEQIRGVNCAIIIRNLLMRGLIEKTEDKKTMTVTYAVTLEFLQHLGITSQTELPEYQVLNSAEILDKVLEKKEQ